MYRHSLTGNLIPFAEYDMLSEEQKKEYLFESQDTTTEGVPGGLDLDLTTPI